jgi:protein-disulfide isomerase
VKNTQQRFWILVSLISIIGAGIIIAMKIMVDAVTVNSNLVKEELALSRATMSELAEVKAMFSSTQFKAPQGAPGAEERAKPGAKTVEGVTAGATPIKGRADAPVLIVQFSDFECPYSRKFYKETMPQIEKDYIATGKVKFAYRDFPLGFHQQAVPAAVASRCAAKQGKYWEIFDQFSNLEKIDKDTIAMSAKLAGLDKDAFNVCINDPAVKGEVQKDMSEGFKFGVKGTPAFFINGRLTIGAVPFEVFKQMIDEELAKIKK